MARETKIGLIVGMGVIIFIGILVSETLNTPPTDVNQPQYVRMMNANEAQTPQVQQPLYAKAQQPPVDDTPVGNVAAVRQQGNTIQRQSAPPTGGGQAVAPPNNTTRHTIHELLGTGYSSNTTDTGTERAVPGGPGGPGVPGVPGDTSTERTSDHPAPLVNRDRIHHVQDGETLYELAVKYYGNGGDWPLIVKANEGKVGTNGSVRKGVRLVIPDKPGQPSVAYAPPTPTPPAPPAPTVTETATPGYKTYTIAKGDVLGKLSQKFYGTSRKWQELYELNKDRIDNPNVLVVGTEIRVPTTP